MKVIHLINANNPFLRSRLNEFCEQLSVKDIQSNVVVLIPQGQKFQWAEKVNSSFSQFYCKWAGWSFSSFKKLAAKIKSCDIDVIHTHDNLSLRYGGIIAKFLKKRCLHTQHSFESELKGFHKHLMDSLVVTSQEQYEKFHTAKREADSHIHLTYDGIDQSAFINRLTDEQKAALRKQIGLREDSFLLGSFGPLEVEQDHLTLLKAMNKLVRKEFKGELLIVGDGSLKVQLQKATKDAGLDAQVRFLGVRADVPELMQLIDVCVYSAFNEAFPKPVLQAFAAGKPVITTKVRGHMELVRDNVNGALVPCGYPERIETAVTRLFIKKDKLSDYDEVNRELAASQFSLDGMADSYVGYYRSLLSS